MDREARQGPGDDAFPDFYARVHEDVYRALALTLQDRGLAAEAAQEGLSRAYARWGEVAATANPAGWVYGAALAWAGTRLRRLMREVSPAASGGPATPSDPKVSSALRELPLEQRAVVVLRLYLDWTVEDTAVALKIPKGTVRSRLQRALERMGDQLEVAS